MPLPFTHRGFVICATSHTRERVYWESTPTMITVTLVQESLQSAELEISTRPLAHASVSCVGRIQISDRSPVCRVRFLSLK